MSDRPTRELDQQHGRRNALSRWEDEGGALSPRLERGLQSDFVAPPLTNTELLQLRVRVIALENLIIALLAKSPDEQHDLVREIALYILPRAGFTAHPMTIRAAEQMLSLRERSDRFRCAQVQI